MEPKKWGQLILAAVAPNLVLQLMAKRYIVLAQKMGPFPAGAGAKAPWPPPLDPPLSVTVILSSLSR